MAKYRVLFVCMGNICRSPAAEGIFQKVVDDAGLSDRIDIDSAGTLGYHEGEPADKRMSASAAKRGYTLTSRARRIIPSDLEKFDKILVADDSNYNNVCAMDTGNRYTAKIGKITEYHDDDNITEVPDPYYGGDAGFENVMDILENSCANLLEEIKFELDAN